MKVTTKTKVAALAVTGVVCATIATAAPALADAQGFIDYVENTIGIVYVTGSNEIPEEGMRICDALNEGYSRSYIAQQVYNNSTSYQGSGGVTVAQAEAFVNASVTYVCPGLGWSG